MTPSLPTLSNASAMISPIDGSPAETEATEAIEDFSSTGFAVSSSRFVTASTAASIPRLTDIGPAPAATARRPR